MSISPPQTWAAMKCSVSSFGEWLVSYQDDDGAIYLTVFSGPEAQQRARDYFAALKGGASRPFGLARPSIDGSSAAALEAALGHGDETLH